MTSNTRTYLESCELALRASGKPMTSRELAAEISRNSLTDISGATPWKTINARISAEILNNGPQSIFVRVGKGLFALREWSELPEYKPQRRVINPISETIAIVRRSEFLHFLRPRNQSPLYDIDYVSLFLQSEGMKRLDAEQTDAVVQLIPLFFIYKGDEYLTYKRTKRLPEQRLHGTRSINFGGHLQVTDFPSLFHADIKTVSLALQRELREELSFEPDEKSVLYEKRVKASIKKISELRKKNGFNIQMRFYQASNLSDFHQFRLVFIDDQTCILSYTVWDKNEGHSNPQLILKATDRDRATLSLYYAFKDYFERLWDDKNTSEVDLSSYR